MRLLRNALNAASITVSEPFGLPTGSLTVMAIVSANPRTSQADLAAQAGITGPSLVGIIDELEELKIVSRVRSTQDRRRNQLVITDKGEECMKVLFATVREIEAPIRAELGEKDMALLTQLLDRALASLSKPKG